MNPELTYSVRVTEDLTAPVFAARSHILVAEDDPNDAFLLRKAFKTSGFDAALHFVSDGEEAIAYLKGEGKYADRAAHPVPAMMLLDLKMPGLNGFDVLTWVRQQLRFISLPVVVLSGSMWPGDIEQSYRLGASSYLMKPLTVALLGEMVRTAATYWLRTNLPAPGQHTRSLQEN
jgi:CheY-like chemotaxis protein